MRTYAASAEFCAFFSLLLTACGALTPADEGSAGANDSADSEVASMGGKSCGLVNLFDPDEQDTPKQVFAGGLPEGYKSIAWTRPISSTDALAPANSGHEGADYIETSSDSVSVIAAASGKVVYVRAGCPQSSEFSQNTETRKCGSGWGNHIVIDHGGIFTRYAHLKPGTILGDIRVGKSVEKGQRMALMGNTGRSDTRHLHFELGVKSGRFDSCGLGQNFNAVYAADALPFGSPAVQSTSPSPATGFQVCKVTTVDPNGAVNVRSSPNKSDNVITTLDNGREVTVRGYLGVWASLQFVEGGAKYGAPTRPSFMHKSYVVCH